MRRFNLAPGEYYHLFNRGNNKQPIFFDNRDYARFLFLIFLCQTNDSREKISRQVDVYLSQEIFDIQHLPTSTQYVRLVCFTLMPNHFHLLVEQVAENGVSKYMQRILNGYTKYFNTKRQISGHLFQGPYKYVHISSNEQLLHTSAYIHRNSRGLPNWKNNEHTYSWSSYSDYISNNRWGNNLHREIIMDQFHSTKDYAHFLKTSPSKLFDEEFSEAEML